MANATPTPAGTHAKSELSKDIFILRQLVTKDFKIKYRRSVLGVLWSVLNPLLMMVVMAAVFTTMFSFRGATVSPELYPLYLILGNITFSFMSDTTSQALTSIIGASSLLKKVKVHRFVFPVQKVLFGLVNFALSFIAVGLVMLWFHIPPTTHLLWLPLFLILLMIFCAGVGMALSALTVFFRDVMHLWSVVITAWMYFTPIFWTIDMIAKMPQIVQLLVRVNPMYNFLTFIRDICMYGTAPSLHTIAMCAGWAVVAIIIGYAIFHKTEHKFILYI